MGTGDTPLLGGAVWINECTEVDAEDGWQCGYVVELMLSFLSIFGLGRLTPLSRLMLESVCCLLSLVAIEFVRDRRPLLEALLVKEWTILLHVLPSRLEGVSARTVWGSVDSGSVITGDLSLCMRIATESR